MKDLSTSAWVESSPSQQRLKPRVNFDLDIYILPLDGILSLVIVVTNTKNKIFFDYLTENGKHLDRTLSTISHDMRAPLQAVVGYSEILTSKLKALHDPDLWFVRKANDCLTKVGATCQTLNNMLSDILDSAQLQHGELKLSVNEFDLKELF